MGAVGRTKAGGRPGGWGVPRGLRAPCFLSSLGGRGSVTPALVLVSSENGVHSFTHVSCSSHFKGPEHLSPFRTVCHRGLCFSFCCCGCWMTSYVRGLHNLNLADHLGKGRKFTELWRLEPRSWGDPNQTGYPSASQPGCHCLLRGVGHMSGDSFACPCGDGRQC